MVWVKILLFVSYLYFGCSITDQNVDNVGKFGSIILATICLVMWFWLYAF